MVDEPTFWAFPKRAQRSHLNKDAAYLDYN